MILPYMEETSLGNLVDVKKTFKDQDILVRETPVPTYLCPSRERDSPLSVPNGEQIPGISDAGVKGKGSGPGVRGDYICVSSTWRENKGTKFAYRGGNYTYDIFQDGAIVSPLKAPNNGFISRTSFKKIIDGLSKTFLIGREFVLCIGKQFDL